MQKKYRTSVTISNMFSFQLQFSNRILLLI